MSTGRIGKRCAQTKEDPIGEYLYEGSNTASGHRAPGTRAQPCIRDQKSSKRIQAKGTAIPKVKDIDIHAWAKQFRSALPKGELVSIYIGDAIAAHIHKPLLKVTSTKFDNLYQNGAFKLPAGTDERVLDRLIGYLGYVCGTSKKPQPMSTNMLMFDVLSISTAGSLLGMDKYTSHVYKKSEAIPRIDPPLYEHINAIISVHEEHARLHRIVVQNLAFRVRGATTPDPEDFQKYLLDHSELAVAIDATSDPMRNIAGLLETSYRWCARKYVSATLLFGLIRTLNFKLLRSLALGNHVAQSKSARISLLTSVPIGSASIGSSLLRAVKQ
ncbi:hypothetical protein HBI95_198210 [Parastagonospora nodorum]|nr:hypothetical protein HBI95_198210 [Parastagonospora nodorum]KAH5068980.1 hypothetical protein HBH95_189220 [Parastagonospora nodorum]KAH5724712.1 hypothetical protein HBI17_244010 [Parastagonospora nodorum]KAH6147370.1 hypothetical protein HBI68_196420 [Parastagonospora nodorum]